MMDSELVLSRNRRNEIMKALEVIERQVKEIVDKSNWQVLWVIGTNLTIIRTNLNDLPTASSN